jgi:hypothetical protein
VTDRPSYHCEILGDMVPTVYTKPTPAVPVRHCPFCQCVMSRYNSGDSCWPCESAINTRMATASTYVAPAPKPEPKPAPKPKQERKPGARPTYQEFTNILKTIDGEFIAATMVKRMSVWPGTVHRWLKLAEAAGFVEPAGTTTNDNLQTVTTWRRKEERAGLMAWLADKTKAS